MRNLKFENNMKLRILEKNKYQLQVLEEQLIEDNPIDTKEASPKAPIYIP